MARFIIRVLLLSEIDSSMCSLSINFPIAQQFLDAHITLTNIYFVYDDISMNLIKCDVLCVRYCSVYF